MAAAPLCQFLNISAFLVLVLASLVCSLSFNLPHISSEDINLHIKVEGDAYVSGQGIQVTPNERNQKMNSKAGRATYVQPLHLWDKVTRELADFTTHFTFNIDSDGGTEFGDGLAFFLANFTIIPFNQTSTAGGGLGLVDTHLITSPEPFVAVVFDTFSNEMNIPMTNVSINIKSMHTSVNSTAWLNNITNGVDNDASITYSASSKILQVVFTGFWDDYNQTGSLSYEVDLRDFLPEFVHIGFSAATGLNFEKHTVTSWQFDSTPLRSDSASVSPAASTDQNQGKNHKKLLVIVGLSIIGFVILLALLALVYICFKKRLAAKGNNEITQELQQAGYRGKSSTYIGLASETDNSPDERKLGEGGFGPTVENDDNQIALGREMGYSDRSMAMDCEFENAGGPKSFSYTELSTATNNFSSEQKLGEGGFGKVYKGMLKDKEVAVKRVSKKSHQGFKHYAAEVKIISQLRHKNLVPLLGWCHEKGELLLVYEYMPGGSLDYHLFNKNSLLDWKHRYGIAQGLASALSYLHKDCEQCVLHRDIKSSNVLLDSRFNARLGDFGLASLVDHENSPEKTYSGGTAGYVAPECMNTGKNSKESDVYSFGIVALEIACGRRVFPWNESEGGGKNLVEWVWNLYGMQRVLEAADSKLGNNFVKQEMEKLMIIGLWCAHPDSKARPKMNQVENHLKHQSQLPDPPSKMPEPEYPICPNIMNLLEYHSGSSYNSCPTGPTPPSTTEAAGSSARIHTHTDC